MPASVWNEKTGIWYLDALMSRVSWQRGPLTYSFPDNKNDYEAGYQEVSQGFAQLPFSQMQAVRYILEGRSSYVGEPVATLMPVEGFTKLKFIDAGFSGSDLRIAQWTKPGYSYGFPPGGSNVPSFKWGDVWLSDDFYYSNPTIGEALFHIEMHELGHALGLSHPHEKWSVGNPLPPARDSLEYSVMSYRTYAGSPPDANASIQVERYGRPQTYMMYDVAALQEMYGANYNFRKGNTVYSWNPTTGETLVDGIVKTAPGGGIGGDANRIFLTIWDGGGRDTYNFSNYAARVVASLEPGGHVSLSSGQRANLGDSHWARGNIFNALLHNNYKRSLIENVTGGSAADRLSGNVAANVLKGGDGNDILKGLAGRDALVGGSGRDTLTGGTEADRFLFGKVEDSLTTSMDVVSDFKRGIDRIDLSRIDARPTELPGNQLFKFIGTKKFTGHQGELRFSKGVLSGDITGDSVADFAIKVIGLKALSASDLIL